ncbi:hypothetical protein NQZ68_008832 [Dissostichus eleginoides]|nr:hypothetical protein NQZ68_008832 [Dissostichus eleginoides]
MTFRSKPHKPAAITAINAAADMPKSNSLDLHSNSRELSNEPTLKSEGLAYNHLEERGTITYKTEVPPPTGRTYQPPRGLMFHHPQFEHTITQRTDVLP